MQAIFSRLPDHTYMYVTLRMSLQMYMLQLNFCFFSLFLCMLMHVKGGRVDCEPSFFFFRFNEGSARELDGPRKERDYA